MFHLTSSTRLSFRHFPSPPGHGLRSQRVNIIDMSTHHSTFLLYVCSFCFTGMRRLEEGYFDCKSSARTTATVEPTQPGGESATSLMPSHAFLKTIYVGEKANASHTVCIPRAPPIVQCSSLRTLLPRSPWMTSIPAITPVTDFGSWA